jgi:hypothetical protein
MSRNRPILLPSCVRRGSPDPAEERDRRSPIKRETCGPAVRLGPPLLAAVPETGHILAVTDLDGPSAS